MSQASSPRISILGDGISTFASVTGKLGAFYSETYRSYCGFDTPDATWWMQVVEKLGGTFVANNSSHGSYISYVGQYPAFLNGRIRKLATEDATPDMILLYSGINDATNDVPLDAFKRDYTQALTNLKKFYPDAQVWCGTLCVGQPPADGRPYLVPPEAFQNIEPYNEVIRECVKEAGCNLADLAAQGTTYSTVNGLHPDKAGMVEFADGWLKILKANQ
jgi:lysophospholipase L1-like esterase